MKHTLKITLLMVSLFLMSQLVGLVIVNNYVDYEKTEQTGQVVYEELPYSIERPDVPQQTSFLLILSGIFIGTAMILVLMRFRKMALWKTWFFLSVLICLSVAFSAFVHSAIAFALAMVFSLIKIFKPNFIVHNFTEMFIYGGIAAIFVPMMNLFAAVILLLAISLYDMFAVWKSKHMVKLAEFQTSSKLFAGLFVPYKPIALGAKKTQKTKSIKIRNAILGGGDMAFPLMFTGVAMKQFGLFKSLIIPVIVALALLILLTKAKKDTFYPAMPFLTIGCFVGYAIAFVL